MKGEPIALNSWEMGLQRYSVQGRLEVRRFCGCPHCDGEERKVRVAAHVFARDGEEAVERTPGLWLNRQNYYDDAEWEWWNYDDKKRPTVRLDDIAEDERMRLVGSPRLIP